MKSIEEYNKEMDARTARYKAMSTSLAEAESHKRAANVSVTLLFFFVCGVLALLGKLTVGWAILLAFSCFILRYTFVQRLMNKWSEKRMAEINKKYPKPEST